MSKAKQLEKSRLMVYRPPAVLLALSLGFALSGCLTVGPDYEAPAVPVPDAWNEALLEDFTSETPMLEAWWAVFEDPQLEALVLRAGVSNRNVRVAAARIQEARALLGVADSQYWPQVGAFGGVYGTRVSEEILPGVTDPENTLFQVGVDVGWELDLFGRVRRSVESAEAGLEASMEDYRDIMVLLYAEVATAYIDVRSLQARIEYAEANAAAQEGTLRLTRDRNKAGLVPDLDVSQAELNVASTRSQIPSLRSQLKQTVNRLGVLLGVYPQGLYAELKASVPVPMPPDRVAVGLPAELLRQRPDVRSSERLLASQHARIGVAKAEFYPIFSLPGTFSLDAFDAGNLNGSALAYSLGPSFRWNLFSAGRVRNNVRAEEARTLQALHQYEQVVLEAVSEVESAMAALAEERVRYASLQQAVAAAERSVELVQTLYRGGLTNFQNVLDMERSLAQQQDALASSEGVMSKALIALYTALGGGWGEPTTDADREPLREEGTPSLQSSITPRPDPRAASASPPGNTSGSSRSTWC